MPTVLTNWTLLQNEASLSATATLPTFSAGSQRIVEILIACYNGSGASRVSASATANGQSATFIVGYNDTADRTSIGVYQFLESQISSINGQVLTTAGASGSQKSVAYRVLSGCKQELPTAVNRSAATANATLTMSLTRAASSLTTVASFCSVGGAVLASTNPANAGNLTLTSNRRISHGSAADTANTSNTTVSGQAYTAAIAWNREPAPAQLVTNINGSDPVSGDTSGNTFVTSGFTETITGVAVGGLSCTSVVDTGNAGTFTVPPPVHTQTYPEVGINQNVVLSGATQSATLAKLFVLNGFTRTVLDNPELVDMSFFTAHFTVPPVNTDLMMTVTADLTPNARGGFETNEPKKTMVLHWPRSTGVMYIYGFVINGGGIVAVIDRTIVAQMIKAKFLSARFYKCANF